MSIDQKLKPIDVDLPPHTLTHAVLNCLVVSRDTNIGVCLIGKHDSVRFGCNIN